MKTIEKGLEEAYIKAGENAYFGNGFKAGVEFAERWIPVEEELPENIEILALYKKDKKTVINMGVGQIARDQIQYFGIVKWRPINQK